jgi:hypothetical protein
MLHCSMLAGGRMLHCSMLAGDRQCQVMDEWLAVEGLLALVQALTLAKTFVERS